ncbi:hypothetical protein K502DRAFT_351814 [Neoconidiobolus thromboides FSU 785]|nr:hypothetical protein K502DRAFT_351814 [Neoconidiobolus thromboides FSU 785]
MNINPQRIKQYEQIISSNGNFNLLSYTTRFDISVLKPSYIEKPKSQLFEDNDSQNSLWNEIEENSKPTETAIITSAKPKLNNNVIKKKAKLIAKSISFTSIKEQNNKKGEESITRIGDKVIHIPRDYFKSSLNNLECDINKYKRRKKFFDNEIKSDVVANNNNEKDDFSFSANPTRYYGPKLILNEINAITKEEIHNSKIKNDTTNQNNKNDNDNNIFDFFDNLYNNVLDLNNEQEDLILSNNPLSFENKENEEREDNKKEDEANGLDFMDPSFACDALNEDLGLFITNF